MKTLILVALLIPCVSVAQFVVGDSVKVVSTTDCVNVRTSASTTGSSILKCEAAGVRGVITAAGQKDLNGSSSYTFFQVQWIDGISGWSASVYLVKIASTPPPPPAPCPISQADSLRIFNLGFASGLASVKTIDSVTIQVQGFKSARLVNDSTIVVKP